MSALNKQARLGHEQAVIGHGLGALSIISAAFFFVQSDQHFGFVTMSIVGMVLIVLLGIATIAATRSARAVWLMRIGGLYLLLAVIQLVTLPVSAANFLGGSASFVSLLGGIGLGLTAIGVTVMADQASRAAPDEAEGAE